MAVPVSPQTGLVLLAQELKVLTNVTRMYAAFAFKHLALQDGRSLARHERQDYSGNLFGGIFLDLRSHMDSIEYKLLGTRDLIYDPIPGFHPEKDPLHRAISDDVLPFSDEHDLQSKKKVASQMLMDLGSRTHQCVIACADFASRHEPLYLDKVQAAAYDAWIRVHSGLLRFFLPSEVVTKSMPNVDWFNEFRHFVYGYSVSVSDMPNALVKIGYSSKKLEYYAAQLEKTVFPCTLSEYTSMATSNRGASPTDGTSRVMEVAKRFDVDVSGEMLFLLGPFRSKKEAVHCEHLIRMLSGKLVSSDTITTLWNANGQQSDDGKHEFVYVETNVLEVLKTLSGLSYTTTGVRRKVDDLMYMAERVIETMGY